MLSENPAEHSVSGEADGRVPGAPASREEGCGHNPSRLCQIPDYVKGP